ncbi:hypothetical protein [Novosphingobium sp. FSW06-99]|uniref:hypothetical protein n=1 Tax=Novosphingobium sp. FSW06-99 TaxID=1739113 RepID=UPI00076C3BB1|nr:hypothetical protein [Novosphingobium sp. FSW06-99]KUR79428.1 hypothetical protein AQZ49_05755 [Novosphingobium sp. FSW06-99]
MTTTHLNGHHTVTLAAIFSHPAPHNIEWHDVVSLLDHIGTATPRHGGGYTVTIGADHITLPRPHGHDLVDDELRHLRTFLAKAGFSPDGAIVEAALERPDTWGIVLIDHHQARLFSPGSKGSNHAALHIIRPEDDYGSRRRLAHPQHNDDHDGGRSSEDEGYYRRIAAELAAAQRIVVFSDGKGRSSAGEYLVDYVKRHDHALATRIIVSESIDISQTSDNEAVAAGLALLATA